MHIIRYFHTAQDARDYRYEHGTGGWIFEPDDGGNAVLYPPDWYPTKIFHHETTKGRSGRLIGSQ